MSNGIELIEANVYMSRAVRLLDAADIDALSEEAGLTPIWSAKGRLVLKHLKIVIRELEEYRTKLADTVDLNDGG